MTSPRVQGTVIPHDRFDHLVPTLSESCSDVILQEGLAEKGYLYLPDVLPVDDVFSARREVFERLENVGEVQTPCEEGISSGTSRREELEPNAHSFWKSVSEGPKLRALTHGETIRSIMAAVLGQPARPHDLMYLRPTLPGRSTHLHYDYPFFARRASRILTAWIPIGDVPLSDGPLLIVEGSQDFDDILDPIRKHDFETDHENEVVQQAAYKVGNRHPVELAEERRTRLLSTDFKAGDLVIFSGFVLHGSLDNTNDFGRIRLSCDVRFQPTKDPADDDRYFGVDPRGSKGGGYGDMRGAKPLC